MIDDVWFNLINIISNASETSWDDVISNEYRWSLYFISNISKSQYNHFSYN